MKKPILRTQKQIQSEINVVEARLQQVMQSSLFDVTETAKLKVNLEKQLAALSKELEVFDAEIIDP